MSVINFPDSRRVDVEWVRTAATDIRDWAALFSAVVPKTRKGVLSARKVETASLRYGLFVGRYAMGRCSFMGQALRIADGDGIPSSQRKFGEDIVSSLLHVSDTIGHGRPWISLPNLPAFKFNAGQTLDVVEKELTIIMHLCHLLLGETRPEGTAA